MRDILVTLLVIGTLPFIFKRPWFGVLVWSWLSYMNPHRLCWGFAYNMPFAQIVAVVLIVAILMNNEKKSIPINATTSLWIIFIIWMLITSVAAIYPDKALEYYERVMKIQLVTFFTLMLMTNQKRIDLLIWTITLSIGFYSIKGGIFTILTGGSFRVYGPEQSMFGENNTLALATLMILPLVYYLYLIQTKYWIKLFLLAALGLSFISALGSQSRGAFVATAAVLAYFWWGSKSKLISGPIIILVAVTGLTFMPERWHERMGSIENYEEDGSAMSRLHAWKYSVNLANDRFIGGGFNSWSTSTYAKYSPEATKTYVAHSIYFNVLADHGWPGLTLFLAIFFLAWRNLSYLMKMTAQDENRRNIFHLAKMMKVSFIAYFSAGAFLSLSYFDLPWHLVAIGVLLRSQLTQSLHTEEVPNTSRIRQSPSLRIT